MKTACVVLSGCGYLDGAEISEAVLSLYFLNVAGFQTHCFAADVPQMHCVDHLTGKEQADDSRNVLHEAARIARGKIKPLSEARATDYSVLMLPGGYGVAKNLSTFAVAGAHAALDTEFDRLLGEALQAKIPIGAVCITPAVLALALKRRGIHSSLTIGNDPDTAAAINALGSTHVSCPVQVACIDEANKIVTAPAYMYDDANIAKVGDGIRKVVDQLSVWSSK